MSRLALLVALGLAALVGCAQFGLQRSTISFDRDETLIFYADLKADVREGVIVLEAACAAKGSGIPPEGCARLGQLRDRARAADAMFQAAVRAKREISLQDLRGLLEVATLVGRFAGVPIPALPR